MSTTHPHAGGMHPWYEQQPTLFIAETLRGIGQVDLQAKLVTGVFITAALFTAGWRPGTFALVGCAASTATAMALGVDRKLLYYGLEGYCGALFGITAVTFLGTHLSTWLVTIGGGIACTVLTATLGTMLGTWKISALTGPFCVVATAMLIGAPGYDRIWHGGPPNALPTASHATTTFTFGHLVESFFNNVSQIFLVGKWWAGVIMLIGLALASRKVALAAMAGSLIGTFTAWAIGAPTEMIRDGLYGYNAVLVMIALAATFLSPTRLSWAYAAVAAIFATATTAAVANFFAPVGGHTLTWPFNLVTWAFLAAIPIFHAITRAKESGS